MAELIAITILIFSLIGIGVILFRKIPVLAELPEIPSQIRLKKERFLFLRIKTKIKELPILKSFSGEIFLQKLLSRIRILTLKVDIKTFNWLKKLREKSQQKKEDNYWEEIKKTVRERVKRQKKIKKQNNSDLPT